MIKSYHLLLLFFCGISFAQFKNLSDFTYENKLEYNCESCIYFKIKNKLYVIDELNNILENGRIIYKCDSDFLKSISVFKKKYLVITYYDKADSKAALGFEYREIIKLVTINLKKSNSINNYFCDKMFSLVQIKQINSHGNLIVEKIIIPELESD